ncbi:MAG TPA: flagellar biosynthetic protein FliQ [Myxococcota bacterium]
MALELPFALVREGLTLLMMTSGPFIGGLLVIGVVVGLLQAMTQLHDPAVSFLPRIAAVILIMIVAGGTIVEQLAAFFTSSVTRMAGG